MTPLHIMLGIHFYTMPDVPYAQDNPCHANSPAVVEYIGDLVNAGLLEIDAAKPNQVTPTTGLAIWIEGLCSIPFPVKEWKIK